MDEYDKSNMKNIFAGRNPLLSLGVLISLLGDECETVMYNKEFVDTIRNLKFDMALVSRFLLINCLEVLPYHLNIPYASIGSLLDLYAMGTPTLPSFMYNMNILAGDQLTFSQRMNNFLTQMFLRNLFRFNIPLWNYRHVLHEFAPGVSNYQELIDHSALFFQSRDHVLESPVPAMPNIIVTPPHNYQPAKPLPTDLDTIVTSNPHGVIVVSFGSMASALPDYCAEKMMQAFGRLQQTVIWKVNVIGKTTEIPKNIHIVSWMPQNDLLGHANTRLFITHSGNNGHYEAVYHGVPMVCFPLFGEQPHNAWRIVKRGYGLSLDIVHFTPDQLYTAITDVLNNASYSQNIKKASAILRDYPMTPRQTVVYWMEHVIKYGSDHLRSHAVNLTWYEYFLIDVIVVLAAVLGAILAVFIFSVRLCYRCVKQRRSTVHSTSNKKQQ